MTSQDELKRRAAERAIELIEPGMKLGLGTGSTAAYFVELLGMRTSKGLDVVGVPASEATRVQCQKVGIRLTTLDDDLYLDLTVDGALAMENRAPVASAGLPQTAAIGQRITLSIFTSGVTPWPRLNICGPPAASRKTASTLRRTRRATLRHVAPAAASPSFEPLRQEPFRAG